MRVFDDYLNNPQYWKKHWAYLLYNRAKSMYDYIRYFNPNWVILNDAKNKDPWKRFNELASPDSSITPFSNQELIDNGYVKILHVDGEADSCIILASKLYWREGILNSFLTKAYVWGGTEQSWKDYGGTVVSDTEWSISPFLLEQLNSVNEHPLKFANLEFYNPSLDIFIPIRSLSSLSFELDSNLPTGVDITSTNVDIEPTDIDIEPTGIDIEPTGISITPVEEFTPTGATPIAILSAKIDLAATELYREDPEETKVIETEVNNGNLSIYYGLSDSLIPNLMGRPLLQLPTSYVVFNNYQPIFDDKQGQLRNIPSFKKHMLIIPMSSSLVYSIIAAYDNNTVSFIGRPVETNGNIRQILFSYNPLPSRFTSKEPLTDDFSLNQTYYNHSYNANTEQDDINIYDFTNHAVWNGESFLEHETYFHNDDNLPIDEMILDETVEFAFFNIDNSISHGYTINVKNNPSPCEHLRVLY